MGKHVIFLGAGASRTSGYPLANELRLLLSSEHHFLTWIKKCFPSESDTAATLASEYFKEFQSAIRLFREGGFASVDEFCRLVSGRGHIVEVMQMRYLTRAVLGALNPEDEFEKSDYYPFIQKLFKADLANLRQDISILSFNYDPYLEFLLWRAWGRRNVGLPIAGVGNEMTSGFLDLHNQSWTESNHASLYLLKLHGSICGFDSSPITTQNLYQQPANIRSGALFSPDNQRNVPPILFPWEIMDERLKFKNADFPPQDDPLYSPLFVKIWERARKEVLAADKVSFVGLSMHDYLKLGFRYLFQGKEGPVQVVVANWANKGLQAEDHAGSRPNPNSPCGRAGELIGGVTNGKVLCRYSERDTRHVSFAPENAQPCVTPRDSFSDFIEHEM